MGLNANFKKSIGNAEAMALVLYVRPLGFEYNHEGMRIFSEAIILAVQSIPVGMKTKSISYLPSRTSVTNSLECMVVKMRNKLGTSWIMR